MNLSEQEAQFIECLRQKRQDDFGPEIKWQDGAWEIKLSTGNKFARGVGASFSSAWDNVAPSWA